MPRTICGRGCGLLLLTFRDLTNKDAFVHFESVGFGSGWLRYRDTAAYAGSIEALMLDFVFFFLEIIYYSGNFFSHWKHTTSVLSLSLVWS